ncbi:IclR family transcriptional regulator [Cupriavidus respiraculi]|uniref:Pectin degradation repressor protein KdgR n=1 Tax=Cupriavidus respiraculi TaxID=195930 RepID=A0ABN7Y111_9BURK|nr:IclR family transcriptional regulator [Cupriavidus respiraculi]CAG9167049.1 Pectin degradation repressor protein KdgR [Cupriavidus respiraculi]
MVDTTPRQPSPTAKVAGTAAFSKFMHVLQLVADAEEPVTVASLVKASGYPRPTVYRIVAALAAEGMLRESARDGVLTLGPRLMQLASRSWSRSDLRLAAVEALKTLRDVTGETVHLAVPNGNTMVYIEKLESMSAVRMASRIGTAVSMHSTAVGKAYLARLPEAELGAVLADMPFPRYTANTVADAGALREQLDVFRARGWSVDDEENEAGIYCFGAAIVDAGGHPLAAVSVSTLRFRQKDDPQAGYVEPLVAACHDIGRRIAESPALAGSRNL